MTPVLPKSGWGIGDSYRFISLFLGQRHHPHYHRLARFLNSYDSSNLRCHPFEIGIGFPILQSNRPQLRNFHDYFVQLLPPSSQHPERRDKQLARIPLRNAKHHFGVFTSRGERGYNEDAWQAGVVDIAPFGEGIDGSKGLPREKLSGPTPSPAAITTGISSSAESNKSHPEANANPVFYFGIFDGHGGDQCSKFLQAHFHDYLEATSKNYGLVPPLGSVKYLSKSDRLMKQTVLAEEWKRTVGGYFRRFKPDFDTAHDIRGRPLERLKPRNIQAEQPPSMENLLFYSFLKCDLDYVTCDGFAAPPQKKAEWPATASQDDGIDVLALQQALEDVNKSYLTPPVAADKPEIVGGSTASVVLISMPQNQVNPIPFWHPAAAPTIITGHVGDTRILLCHTETGEAHSMTSNHHPNLPSEAKRLRRYAASFVTDSFGEERFGVLANTRAFGDVRQKRLGVSAEPEIAKVTLQTKGEYAFLVMVTDGISGTLTDQEIVDVVKDANTPDQASKALVNLAVEVTKEGDNATAIVVRLGGWEQRGNGDGTKELRNWRRREAEDIRTRRM